MEIEALERGFVDNALLQDWYQSAGIQDRELALTNLVAIRDDGMPLDLLAKMMDRLAEGLAKTGDADAVLNNLQRFVRASRSPQALGGLFDRDQDALSTLLRIFSVSQYLADQLIGDPDCFDFIRMTDGQSVSRSVLVDEISNDVLAAPTEAVVLRCLRDFRHRETLRIAFGDFIGRMPIEVITEQTSILAEALCDAAFLAAQKTCRAKWGIPQTPEGKEARFSILALGKLGGCELNYASDIDLMYIAETQGRTKGPKSITNQEYFDRLAQLLTRFLSEVTPRGRVYKVDLRLRPHGASGPMVSSLEGALQYYDESGRTWERQAFIKARPVAGDLLLGEQFLESLQPWIYRRYLSAADITGIRALKRRIEHGAKEAGVDDRNVKTGKGGIRDIEFVIQFLQLLNGADWIPVRTGNTLLAISRLEQMGCLTPSERTILEENYRFLRRVEHHLQIMYDHQTHVIPEDDKEQSKLAIRMGFAEEVPSQALHRFQAELMERTKLNRKILDHLLHDAFGGEEDISDETDLVLDPEPSIDRIQSVLGKYAFRDPLAAHRLLMDLASERVSFLSTRRCRHFLAAIAEKLLIAISQTPDPDLTLVNLSRMSDSLGGKAVLWELFSFHPASLSLCVRLCAASPYLIGLLTANPGMIDELLDSLMLDRLPSESEIDSWLQELCHGAEDAEPIVHAFKNAMHLRVGVRDVLGKEGLTKTHEALSNLADACLHRIIESEFQRMVQRYGLPTVGDGPRAGQDAELIVLALGKLGGREPNYHSDLDVMFLFDEEGSTRGLVPHLRHQPTTNRYFFNQLAQRISQTVNRVTGFGKLYDLDTRLRPLGSSGNLAIAFDDLREYFASGSGQFWERQLLCKARVIWGSEQAEERTSKLVYSIVSASEASPELASQIHDMRMRLESSASSQNLKRGRGGTVDVEFLVQMLQLFHAKEYPKILATGTLAAIEKLKDHQLLHSKQAQVLTEGYLGLRRIESGLRLMNTTARHDLPEDESELARLAFLLHLPDGAAVVAKCEEMRTAIRAVYDQTMDIYRAQEAEANPQAASS
ncbi:MAG: bifunctional [glutamate--ammonia ligase]-adenylyl-L-tyrosine phosphorylase/[glutamate--ammonia-ligase] adenylyltransferase [Pirellulales bacterium]